jgi:hypothetical protein
LRSLICVELTLDEAVLICTAFKAAEYFTTAQVSGGETSVELCLAVHLEATFFHRGRTVHLCAVSKSFERVYVVHTESGATILLACHISRLTLLKTYERATT